MEINWSNGIKEHMKSLSLTQSKEWLLTQVEKYPGESVLFSHLAFVSFMQSDLEISSVYLNRAIELKPSSIPFHLSLITLYCDMGAFEQACEEFKRLESTQHPNAPWLFEKIANQTLELSKNYHHLGQTIVFEKTLEKALDLNKKNPATYKQLVKASLFEKNFEKAHQYLDQWQRIAANDYEDHYWSIIILLEEKKLNKAKNEFSQFPKENPFYEKLELLFS